MTIILVNALSARLPGSGGGLGAAADVPAGARAQIAPLMAEAFGHTFWWAFGLLLIAFGAAWLLPRSRPRAPEVEADEDVAAPPVLMHA
jgi:hypothetical protein